MEIPGGTIWFFSFQVSTLDFVKKFFPLKNIILRIKSYATLEEGKQNGKQRIISHGEVSTFYQFRILVIWILDFCIVENV